MTSPRLLAITRRLDRAKPAEKTPASGDLGAAIEALIEQRVEERVSAELGTMRERMQQHSPRVQQLMRTPAPSAESPPPAPRTAPPTDHTVQVVRRDENGRLEVVEVDGKMRMKVERDSLGRTVRLVEIP